MTVKSPEPGRRYQVTGDIKALCCTGALYPGNVIRVVEQTSKNRLLIKNESRGGLHKVKRSTFRMNVEEVGDE